MAAKPARLALYLAGAAALAGLILYTGGFLSGGGIAPGRVEPKAGATAEPPATTMAREAIRPRIYEAVGTVRPRTETRVEAQVRGKVLRVEVRPGELVKAGQLLVLLDDAEIRTRLEQARSDLSAAEAALKYAEAEYGRFQRLLAAGAAPKQEWERAQEARQRTRAARQRAAQRVEEARISLGYTRITAPEAGQVAKRLIDPGDLALPGRPLLVIQTGGALRLEALVREGLINRVRLGQDLEVAIPALEEVIPGKVEEIVPSADPQTRTFLVKVWLPATEGLYTGMFGRLLIPEGQRRVILAPAAAIRRVGQLEMVEVKTPQGWRRVHVTTGRASGDMVEVLSGLEGGEVLGMPAPASTDQTPPSPGRQGGDA